VVITTVSGALPGFPTGTQSIVTAEASIGEMSHVAQRRSSEAEMGIITSGNTAITGQADSSPIRRRVTLRNMVTISKELDALDKKSASHVTPALKAREWAHAKRFFIQ
jgi:hypothetical protein